VDSITQTNEVIMKVGDLVQRNPDVWQFDDDVGTIIEIEDEDEIVVIWSCGYRNIYSIYDLEVICK
tara:strand:- start:2682 stop:2879 length:198 start_codon:yes stop_codon:yes gene_type:complete